MRVRCATQRDHVFHPEMNYSQTQLDQLDRLTERWVADHLQKGKTSKKDKELVTLEYYRYRTKRIGFNPPSHPALDFNCRWIRAKALAAVIILLLPT
jgi:hypothetical protein